MDIENTIQLMVLEAFSVTWTNSIPSPTDNTIAIAEKNDILRVSGFNVFVFISQVT